MLFKKNRNHKDLIPRGVGTPIVFTIFHFIRPIYVSTQNSMLLACLELQDFGGVVIVIVIVIVIVTRGKQSQLLVFWTLLGLEFDNITST